MASNDQIDSKTVPNFIKNRSCTNCCFLFIFIGFLAGWGVLTFFAFKYGDPEQVFLPTDSSGGICGRGILEGRHNLFYFNILKCAKLKSITSGCNTEMACVSKCPNYTLSYAEYKRPEKFDSLSEFQKKELRKNLICKYEIGTNFNDYEIPTLLSNGNCASLYLKSVPRFGRCIPTELRKRKNKFLDDNNKPLKDNDKFINPKQVKDTSTAFAITFNAQALGELVLSDILTIKYFLLYGLIIGMLVSFAWILLMQLMAGVMVWLSMLCLIVFSGYSTYFSYYKYKYYVSKNDTELDKLEDDDLDSLVDIDFLDLIKVQLNSILSDSRIWLALIIISAIVFFILLVTFVALRQRVRIAIALIKEASKAIMEAKFTLILPFVPYIVHFALFIFSVVVALLLIATYKPVYRFENGPDTWKYCDRREDKTIRSNYTCTKFKIIDDKYIYYIQGYNLFGFFWVWFFIHGMFQLIFAGVFSRYYWTFNKKKDLPTFLIFNSTYTAFRYHTGSVALGSFLTATVKIIQVIIEYIDQKCKQYGDNPLAKGIIWCFRCCFWVLDNFLRYINKNAYIMIAVYGKGYFTSAKDAFTLILNNVVRAVVIDKVTDYILFFAKLSCTAIMGVCTYYVIENYEKLTFDGRQFPELNYPHAVPIGLISLGTYFIASSFFSVYEMAVNTIFLCFLKDCEINDGSSEKRFYMSKSLLKILHKTNSSTSIENGRSSGTKSSETLE